MKGKARNTGAGSQQSASHKQRAAGQQEGDRQASLAFPRWGSVVSRAGTFVDHDSYSPTSMLSIW